MKMLVVVAMMVLGTTSAQAAKADLKVFNALVNSGALVEGALGKTYVSVNEIECTYSNHTKKYDCSSSELIDIEVGEKAVFIPNSKNAKIIFNALVDAGGQMDTAMGKVYVTAQAIVCAQLNDSEYGPEAKRTTCDVQLSRDQRY